MAQSSVRIATDLHAEPHIEGRRVTVRRIQGLVEETGHSAEEVAERLDLDVSEVYGALQYYHSHPGEIRDAEQERADREREARHGDAKTLTEIKREQT